MTAYTPWHVARLRNRLALFRKNMGEQGRPLTWHVIADRLCKFEGGAFKEAESSLPVLAEALRRFTEGKHVLRPDRLDALAAFLKSVGCYHDEDIGETQGSYELAMAMLAQTGGPSRAGPPAAYGVYVASERHGPAGNAVSTLELLEGHDPAVIPFRETIEYSPSAKLSERAFDPARLQRFAGYAVEHREGWFVRRNPDDALALVEARSVTTQQLIYVIPHIPTNALASPHLFLMKIDRFVPPDFHDIPAERVLPGALREWAASRTWRYVRQGSAGERELRAGRDGRPLPGQSGFAWPDEPSGVPPSSLTFMDAARYGFAGRVADLLSSGAADVNAVETETGATGLHYAAASNAIAVLRVLAGRPDCDFTVMDKRGRTPATLAFEIGRNPVTGRFLRMKEMAQHRARGTHPDYSSWYRPAKA